MKRRAIVFAREPRAGAVKTRLAAAIGAQRALEAYLALLRRTLAAVAAAPADERVLSVASDDGQALMCAALAREHGMRLALQGGGDLGERMSEALHGSLREGALPVLLGSDCPVLDAGDLDRAFDALGSHDAAFAPAEDGGYALVGIARPLPAIFSGIAWGGGDVMEATRARLRAEGARWHELRTVWDVDTVEDLERWRACA